MLIPGDIVFNRLASVYVAPSRASFGHPTAQGPCDSPPRFEKERVSWRSTTTTSLLPAAARVLLTAVRILRGMTAVRTAAPLARVLLTAVRIPRGMTAVPMAAPAARVLLTAVRIPRVTTGVPTAPPNISARC
jgi:hypothetical protein